MVSVILAGGGNVEKSKKCDSLFSSLVKGDRKILYIPIAMPEESHSFAECLEWFKSAYQHFNFQIEMWTNLIDKKDANQFDGVYIGGGNTYLLLHRLQESGFLKVIQDFVEL